MQIRVFSIAIVAAWLNDAFLMCFTRLGLESSQKYKETFVLKSNLAFVSIMRAVY